MQTINRPANIFDLQEAIAAARVMAPMYSRQYAAEVFAEFNKDVIKWLPRMGRWAVWRGDRWLLGDKTVTVGAMCNLTLGLAALAAQDEALGRANASTARSIASDTFVSGALMLARPLMADEVSAFDVDPWLINVHNGIVDLRTGELTPHAPERMMTKMANVTYSQSVSWRGTRFGQFLSEVFGGDDDLISYMQRQLGYCLTGDNAIHEMFFWYGSGRNGKSTLADLVMSLMGDYARKIGSEVLMATKNERHKTEVAQLMGVRLAVASEIDKGSYWNESRIKELTGDETINARFIAQDSITFTRTHKLIIQGNNRPHMKDIDVAIIKRVRMVPFSVNFDELGTLDPTLPEQLRQEAAAVFNWMVEGAMAVYNSGRKLGRSAVINEATREYLDDNDMLQMWMRDNCVISDELNDQGFPKVRTGIRKLYKDYAEWKKERGEGVEGERGFKEMLLKAKFKEFKKDGRVVFGRIGLKEEQSVRPEDDGPTNVISLRR